MKDKITREKIERYLKLSEKALKIVKKKIIRGKENKAREIIEMASNYLSDARHFKSKTDFVNAFAAVNYAHGWIDSGVRLGIFNVKDERLFTVR
ncbi:DUF357 domain-containing protein [Candidatus Pacearchaeota archaeon]|nr:DUF357 domain-containing protein [Candidatus Pacearchaeota archaeon]